MHAKVVKNIKYTSRTISYKDSEQNAKILKESIKNNSRDNLINNSITNLKNSLLKLEKIVENISIRINTIASLLKYFLIIMNNTNKEQTDINKII